MGQITQIAFELRNITQLEMNEADSDEEDLVETGDEVENFHKR